MKLVELPEVEEVPDTRVELIDAAAEKRAVENRKAAESAEIAALPVRVIAVNGIREQFDILDPNNKSKTPLTDAIRAGYRIVRTAETPGSGYYGKTIFILERPNSVDEYFTPRSPDLSEGK